MSEPSGKAIEEILKISNANLAVETVAHQPKVHGLPVAIDNVLVSSVSKAQILVNQVALADYVP